MLAHFQPTNEETPDNMPNSGPVQLKTYGMVHTFFVDLNYTLWKS